MGVLMLGDLSVVVDRQFHITEVIHCSRRIKVHNIAADSVLCDFATCQSFAELAFLLFALSKHFVVDWTRREIGNAW